MIYGKRGKGICRILPKMYEKKKQTKKKKKKRMKKKTQNQWIANEAILEIENI